MKNTNVVILSGNLGRDPEMKYTPGGQAVTEFSIAVNDDYKAVIGQGEEIVKRVYWVNVQAWGNLAEVCNKFLTKGSKVIVHGSLQITQYERDGQTKYYTRVKANSVEFGSKPNGHDEPEPQEDAEVAESFFS